MFIAQCEEQFININQLWDESPLLPISQQVAPGSVDGRSKDVLEESQPRVSLPSLVVNMNCAKGTRVCPKL